MLASIRHEGTGYDDLLMSGVGREEARARTRPAIDRIPPRQIPQGTEERAALYRGRLAGTRTLIVLDNAADEAQVRPLIPGDAGCLVLITSRRKLKSLDDAHVVALTCCRTRTRSRCWPRWPGRGA